MSTLPAQLEGILRRVAETRRYPAPFVLFIEECVRQRLPFADEPGLYFWRGHRVETYRNDQDEGARSAVYVVSAVEVQRLYGYAPDLRQVFHDITHDPRPQLSWFSMDLFLDERSWQCRQVVARLRMEEADADWEAAKNAENSAWLDRQEARKAYQDLLRQQEEEYRQRRETGTNVPVDEPVDP